jgi:hypothetical protein
MGVIECTTLALDDLVGAVGGAKALNVMEAS